MPLPNPFGDTSSGLIGNINNSMGFKSAPTPNFTPAPVGIQTKNPTDNIQAKPNVTQQPKVKKPISGGKTTDGGTLNTNGNTNPPRMTSPTPPSTQTPPTSISPTTAPNTQPTTPTPTPYSPNDSGLYGKLIADLANRSQQSGADYQNAQAEAKRISDEQTALSKDFGQKDTNIQGTAGFLTQASGLEGQLQKQYDIGQSALASQYQGATNRLNAANTQQGLLQQALQQAAQGAQPTQVPYNNQFLNPVTGQPIGGGQVGQLPQSAQDAVNIYAQQVKNGQMTRADAESRLQAYGVAGTNALTQALGQSFNTNASNASAGTTAVGQQIKTAADSTNKALDTLASSFSSLSSLQTGGIPATNNIANWIASNLGDKALTQYKTNLADARSQLIGVLNSSGGTPTGNEATANQYLPDNMTKAQFDQNVGTQENPGIVRQLIQQKVGSFTASGSQNTSSTQTQKGNMFGNFFGK